MGFSITYRIKRKWRDLTILRQQLGAGPAGEDKISLVLYVDYEGRFGKTDIQSLAESGFLEILNVLRDHEIKATWNCVGLLAEHHQETIEQIIMERHEIACHTYSHIVPLASDKDKLAADIHQFNKVFKDKFNLKIEGFHSPQDAWSKPLIEILADHNFSYDIAMENDPRKQHASYLSTFRHYLFKKRSFILRIPSVCDDWMFISENLTASEMLKHWQSFLSEHYKGKTIAMGFHPWVIGKDKARTNVFETFLNSTRDQEYVKIYTGREIAKWYMAQN